MMVYLFKKFCSSTNVNKIFAELAEGSCVKNYDYMGSGGGFGKGDKKWTSELPTDSHLLLYLLCAFLEHPKWMLHVDPTSYSGAQSSKNPLFLGLLPPVERFPEKYVAVISGVPSVLHPGACILAVGKQSPPIFALYWDKKLQFSLQVTTIQIVSIVYFHLIVFTRLSDKLMFCFSLPVLVICFSPCQNQIYPFPASYVKVLIILTISTV